MANLASVANARGDHHGAIRLLREVLAAEREEESESLANTLNNLGLALEAVGETAEARQSFEEAVAIARVQNLAETIPYALASLAHLLVRTDPSEAGRHYDESLMLFQEMADLRGIAYCLDGLATLALEDDDAPRAAKLLAAAAVLRTRTGVALDSTEQIEVDTAVASARERLGAESFEAAWSDGARLELDDAVALALAPSAAERSMHA
jgi:tetratricopeptide (TPR) repeat protein